MSAGVPPNEGAIGAPEVEVAFCTDPGRDPSKRKNEDACGHRATRHGYLGVVCDGMGGHSGGAEAANLALAKVLDFVERAPLPAQGGIGPAETLHAAIERANEAVFAMPPPDPRAPRPGSTVVAVLAHARGTELAHAGDSRAYWLHEGQIFQLTKDHSMVQQLVDAKLLTPAQAANHEHANVILRAVGMSETLDVEVRPAPVHHDAGDVFLLCSDGISDLVEPNEMMEAVRGRSCAEAARVLVDLANARGGHDNLTVLLVRMQANALGEPRAVKATQIDESRVDTAPTMTGPKSPSAQDVAAAAAPAQTSTTATPAQTSTAATPAQASNDAEPARRAAPSDARTESSRAFARALGAVGAVVFIGAAIGASAWLLQRSGQRGAPPAPVTPAPTVGIPAGATADADAGKRPAHDEPRPVAPIPPASAATAEPAHAPLVPLLPAASGHADAKGKRTAPSPRRVDAPR
jgi:protein phosphatase